MMKSAMLKKLMARVVIAALLIGGAGFDTWYMPAADAQFAGQSLFARAASSGTANAQTITLDNVLSLSDLRGETVSWIVGTGLTNTGAATLNIDTLGAVAIERMNGGSLVALAGGEMPAGKMVQAAYDGTELILLTNYAAGVPAGQVAYFDNASCPSGWSPANGTNNTVNVVGQFIRSLNTAGTGFDPNRTLASAQSNSVQALGWSGSVTGNVSYNTNPAYVGTTNSPAGVDSGPSLAGNIVSLSSSNFSWSGSVSGSVTGTGTETRPQNVALLACQKN